MSWSFRFAARFAGSLLLAAIVVATMLGVGLYYFGEPESAERSLMAFRVDELTAEERRELARILGLDGRLRRLPELRQALKPALPPRIVNGFVQIEYDVLADGSVANVEVVGAAPAGYYEDQARAIVTAKRFSPDPQQSGRRTEFVDFAVPARDP